MRQTDLHYYYTRSSGGAAQRDDIFPSDGTDDGDGEAEIGHANVFRYSATNQSDRGREEVLPGQKMDHSQKITWNSALYG